MPTKAKRKTMCFYCGRYVTKINAEGVCDKCKNIDDEEKKGIWECDFCGERIEHEDDVCHTSDGEIGCSDCVRFCEWCDEYHYHERVYECEKCGMTTCEIHNCEDCDKYLCEDCIKSCEECGNNFCEDCLKEKDGKRLCSDCIEDIEIEEEATGKKKPKKEGFKVGDKVKLVQPKDALFIKNSNHYTETTGKVGESGTIKKITKEGNLMLKDIIKPILNNGITEEDEYNPKCFKLVKKEFEIGTKVRIRKNTRYSNQNSGIGVIKEKKNSGWFRVDFEDGYINSYQRKDLELV